jgi:hypothetical protein
MKRSDVKVSVTFGEISSAPLIGVWDIFCHKYGYDRYCLKEGADINTKIEISLSDAEYYGIIED